MLSGKSIDHRVALLIECHCVLLTLPLCRSTVTGYAKFSPGTAKWTKHTIAEHVSIGGNGPVIVGTPAQVAGGLQTWVDEADVDGFNFVSQRTNNDQRSPLEDASPPD